MHYEKNHRCTTGGLKNALARVRRELSEYSESWGGGAVCSGWIETPFGRIEQGYAAYLVDYKFANADELGTAMYDLNKLLVQINRERDEEYEQEREQMIRDYPLECVR